MSRSSLLGPVFLLLVACSGGGSEQPADASATPLVDGAPIEADATPEISGSCPESFIGSGDGCDCGCGIADPDCPTPTRASDCQYDGCGDEAEVDPEAPTQCIAIAVPAGWTCSAYFYGADNACTCGCGAFDDQDCDTPLTPAGCYDAQNGCNEGSSPDPADPTQCIATPVGWTCNWTDYYDGDCDCGCGIADPACPVSPHFTQCDSDQCESGLSPDPLDLTSCINNAPQDDWTCDPNLLLDGSQCDCGCSAADPDCAGASDEASCDAVHCGVGDELKPDSIYECWEECIPLDEPVGNATCTNGGFFSIFNSCERHLSACTDGKSYEVECTGGDCVCRVNGNCVAHASGSCSLNFTCGWSLTDNT